jgi:oxygen-independent coproporphyrinogen-3 oxidase
LTGTDHSFATSRDAGHNAQAFGVYIHWPFCLSKCPYCDFNSHVRREQIDEPRWVRAFAAEIAATAARVPGRTVSSIFFGGGTPSLMRPATIAGVIEAVARHWRIAPDVEITLEANPTSVEVERFRGYRAAGVNRVSLGVQALEDRDLATLGRTHSAREALNALGVARAVFDRYSFDPSMHDPIKHPNIGRASCALHWRKPASMFRSTSSRSSRRRPSPRSRPRASLSFRRVTRRSRSMRRRRS